MRQAAAAARIVHAPDSEAQLGGEHRRRAAPHDQKAHAVVERDARDLSLEGLGEREWRCEIRDAREDRGRDRKDRDPWRTDTGHGMRCPVGDRPADHFSAWI